MALNVDKSPKIKALRTGFQTVLAVATYIVAVAAIPEFKDFVEGKGELTALIIPVLSMTFAYFQNKVGR